MGTKFTKKRIFFAIYFVKSRHGNAATKRAKVEGGIVGGVFD